MKTKFIHLTCLLIALLALAAEARAQNTAFTHQERLTENGAGTIALASLPVTLVTNGAIGGALAGAFFGAPAFGSPPPTPIPFEALNLAPTVVLLSPTDGSTSPLGSPVFLYATAMDSDGSVTKVDFFAGETLLGTSEPLAGVFVYLWEPAARGVYAILARATDNLGAVGTSQVATVTITSSTIDLPPTVSLRWPTNGAELVEGRPVILQADAHDDGRVVSVEFLDFYDTEAPLGTVVTPPYTLSLENLELGEYVFEARATDDTGNVTISDTVAFKIVPPPPNLPPTVQLFGVRSLDKFPVPARITVTSAAQDSDGTVVSVEYFDGERSLGISETPPYRFTISGLGFGIHTLTARATDNNGGVGASRPATIQAGSSPAGVPMPALAAALDKVKGKIALTATADSGFYYALEASPDLVNWYRLEEFLMTSGVWTFERDLVRTAEFFRLQQVVAADLPNPLRVFTDTIGRNSVQGEATFEPFTLSLTNSVGSIFTLHIPTNALFSPTLISMTEVRDASNFPFAVGAAEAVEFQPKGLMLLDAATVTVKRAGAPGTRKVTGFAYRSDGSDFRFIPVEAVDNTLTMGVFSLAGCGVSFITADELQAQELRRPLELSAAGEQAAALFSLVASPHIRALAGDHPCDSLPGRVVNRKAYYNNILKPNREKTCDTLVSDWRDFTEFRNRIWRRGCEAVLADELVFLNYSITELTSGARVKRCIEEKVDECRNGPFAPEEMVKLLRLYAFAKRVVPPEFFATEIEPLVKKCIRFELEFRSDNSGIGRKSIGTFTAKVRDSSNFEGFLMEFSSGLVTGQEDLEYTEFTQTPPEHPCEAMSFGGMTTGNGHVRAQLEFNINYTDLRHGLWDRNAVELRLGIGPIPTELTMLRIVNNCPSGVGQYRLDRLKDPGGIWPLTKTIGRRSILEGAMITFSVSGISMLKRIRGQTGKPRIVHGELE